MPRALRKEYPGAIYHGMDGGDRLPRTTRNWVFGHQFVLYAIWVISCFLGDDLNNDVQANPQAAG
jgi:predicted branched-subunit amino acid permease